MTDAGELGRIAAEAVAAGSETAVGYIGAGRAPAGGARGVGKEEKLAVEEVDGRQVVARRIEH